MYCKEYTDFFVSDFIGTFGLNRNPMGTAVYFSDFGKGRKTAPGNALACFGGARRFLLRRHQKAGGQQ